MKTSLDTFEILMPTTKRSYLVENGYEFNRKACECAVKMMRKANPNSGNEEPVKWVAKEEVDRILTSYGIEIKNKNGYNYVYAWHWFKADYSDLITDDHTLSRFVKAAIDDVDMPGGNFFRRWLADCAAKGIVIDWEDFI